ncbi:MULTISPECIES: hypothetical protein [Bacillota]|uniref:hypothetical protein n=1 Tax=Bacillota TaxID=1239 RepID=UPI000B4481E9|nr:MULTISPECIES: hypothetical protein [Bacillota]OUN34109.1 hypothetical protein B5G32_09415 [Massilimicrobiota sp. An80]QUN13284.1 hypothetical protein KEC48_01800 [Clostridium sp. C1]
MKLEYLIHKEKLSICNSRIDTVNKKKKMIKYNQKIIPNTELLYFCIEIVGDNKDNARILSEINDILLEDDEIIVVSNEASEYFNKTLFPLINAFERKLRKLLYLATADNTNYKDKIQMLEKKDLGTIFGMLFVDEKFTQDTLKWMNSNKHLMSKEEILKYIKDHDEESLWSELFSKSDDDILKENYMLVKTIRNDVMHAHNINYETYSIAKKLFEQLNEQLDNQIDNCGIVESRKNQFNITLSEKLNQQYNLNMDFGFNNLIELKDELDDINKHIYQLSRELKSVVDLDFLKKLNDNQEKLYEELKR